MQGFFLWKTCFVSFAEHFLAYAFCFYVVGSVFYCVLKKNMWIWMNVVLLKGREKKKWKRRGEMELEWKRTKWSSFGWVPGSSWSEWGDEGDEVSGDAEGGETDERSWAMNEATKGAEWVNSERVSQKLWIVKKWWRKTWSEMDLWDTGRAAGGHEIEPRWARDEKENWVERRWRKRGNEKARRRWGKRFI